MIHFLMLACSYERIRDILMFNIFIMPQMNIEAFKARAIRSEAPRMYGAEGPRIFRRGTFCRGTFRRGSFCREAVRRKKNRT